MQKTNAVKFILFFEFGAMMLMRFHRVTSFFKQIFIILNWFWKNSYVHMNAHIRNPGRAFGLGCVRIGRANTVTNNVSFYKIHVMLRAYYVKYF